jgi:predicted RNase H-related nuclease YkuK (DUF458 family)
MRFKNYLGDIVSIQDITASIDNFNEYKVFVGTDSKISKNNKKVSFVSAIVLYHKGKGGRIFLWRESTRKPVSLRARLTEEVYRSIQVSMEVSQSLPAIPIVVHIDVNASKKYKSGEFYQELTSMVVSQGFKCEIKPDAWVASKVADKFVKKMYKN